MYVCFVSFSYIKGSIIPKGVGRAHRRQRLSHVTSDEQYIGWCLRARVSLQGSGITSVKGRGGAHTSLDRDWRAHVKRMIHGRCLRAAG